MSAPKRCPTTGKAMYRTERSATNMIHALWRNAELGAGPLPTRAYPCSDCKRWHLTSMGGVR